MARPTTHDATITDEVFRRIGSGEYAHDVFTALNVSPDTFYSWLQCVPGLRDKYFDAKERHALFKLEKNQKELEELETEFCSGANEYGETWGQASARIAKCDLNLRMLQWWAKLIKPALYGDKAVGRQGIKGKDSASKMQSLINSINTQQITPADAAQVANVLQRQSELSEIATLNDRLAALEAAQDEEKPCS